MTVSVSVLTLTCISIERWYAICHPLKVLSRPSRAKWTIVVIWVSGLIISLPEPISLGTKPLPNIPEGSGLLLTSCTSFWSRTVRSIYQLCLIIALYFLPLLVIFVTYVLIACTLSKNAIPSDTSEYSV